MANIQRMETNGNPITSSGVVTVMAALTVLTLSACDSGNKTAEPAQKTRASSAQHTSKTPAQVELASETTNMKAAIVDHTVKSLSGEDVKLSDYHGKKALLIVNTASACGFTPQYAGLQKLYADYKERGLEVLAFPSNDFGEQEPGSNEEIREFVDKTFSVEFPMFDKVHAKGPNKAPLYKTLTEETRPGIRGDVQWNFTKFLVDSQGQVVARFEPKDDPGSDNFRNAVEKVLPR